MNPLNHFGIKNRFIRGDTKSYNYTAEELLDMSDAELRGPDPDQKKISRFTNIPNFHRSPPPLNNDRKLKRFTPIVNNRYGQIDYIDTRFPKPEVVKSPTYIVSRPSKVKVDGTMMKPYKIFRPRYPSYSKFAISGDSNSKNK